ncbi:MAG: cyclase family protein [Myxococcota bacterium]
MENSKVEEHPWIDVSVPIHPGMVVYPGDPPVLFETQSSFEKGDEATLTRIDMSAHTGTHVDAPVHFVPGGAGVDQIPLFALVGPALVVHLPDVDVVSAADLERLDLKGVERLLLKTRNSQRSWKLDDFDAGFVHLSLDAARMLAAAGLRAVGIDYLSIGGGDANPDVHRTLLSGGVCVIEGLDLSGVDAGTYDLVCLPLRIRGGDGAPARAILRRR